jgi:pilus assembly protein CpaE
VEIGLNILDLFSTNVLVLDAEIITKQDLQVITNCTRENSNPAIIVATNDRSEFKLTELMRAGVSEVISLPIIEDELHEAVTRLRACRYISTSYHPRGKILSFLSSKGGAGSTFIAGNLGYALATQFDKKVLFIDLHMQFGDASFYLAERMGPTTLADIIGQAGLDSSVIASATIQIDKNYNLLQAPDSPEKAAGIKPQHVDDLLTVAIQDFDYVIVDVPKTIDAISMKVLDRSDRIFTVLQPVIPYIRATSKILQLYGLLGYESNKIYTILNRMDSAASISTSKIEDAIQKSINFILPNDYVNCMHSVNAGIPLHKLSVNSHLSQSITQMASEIVEIGAVKPAAKQSFFAKWFG